MSYFRKNIDAMQGYVPGEEATLADAVEKLLAEPTGPVPPAPKPPRPE